MGQIDARGCQILQVEQICAENVQLHSRGVPEIKSIFICIQELQIVEDNTEPRPERDTGKEENESDQKQEIAARKLESAARQRELFPECHRYSEPAIQPIGGQDGAGDPSIV